MKQTILIVDDFESTRFVIEFTLSSCGYTILKAIDGKDALKYFDGRKIDLVITDYNMPNMDGRELVQTIRNMPDYKYLPILMLTTETNEKKKQLAHEAKITGWIQKPFERERFLAIVKKSLTHGSV